mgnify:CR=1 FL=1
MSFIPLLKAKYVDHYKWMSDKEALDLVSVAQSAPGVVAVNAAIIIGYRLAGYTGAAVTLLATVMPPLITLTVDFVFLLMLLPIIIMCRFCCVVCSGGLQR